MCDTPYYAIWISGILMALLVLLADLNRVVALSTFGQLIYYVLANISNLKLRARKNALGRMVPALFIEIARYLVVPFMNGKDTPLSTLHGSIQWQMSSC